MCEGGDYWGYLTLVMEGADRQFISVMKILPLELAFGVERGPKSPNTIRAKGPSP